MNNDPLFNSQWFNDIDSSKAGIIFYHDDKKSTNVDEVNDFFKAHQQAFYLRKYSINLDTEMINHLQQDRFLTDKVYHRVLTALLPSRENALSLLHQANITPSFENLGSLTSINRVNGCHYPRINQSTTANTETVVDNLELFHRNVSVDNIACDELIYMLYGSVHFYFYVNGKVVHLEITAANGKGWLLTYKGSIPHGGVFSPIVKQLAVLMGPKEWEMRFYRLSDLSHE